MPPDYLDTLNTAHGIREAQTSRKQAGVPIWSLSRVRVWQIVKDIMIEAGIPDAPHRSPKGLRHGFGVNATVNGVPLHMLQKWMGHAQRRNAAVVERLSHRKDGEAYWSALHITGDEP